MIHFTHDFQVDVEPGRRLASTLEWAHRPHELILLERESHPIEGEKARATVRGAIERFVRANPGPVAFSPPS